MKLSKILLLLLTASSASLALAGGGSYDDSNTSSAATPTAALANSTSQKEMKLSDGFKGFYITVKGGVSESRDTGKIHFEDDVQKNTNEDEDLGAGYIFGLSVGKYITNNLRLELEASQRGDLEFNSAPSGATPGFEYKADIDTKSVFINGFYDFESFVISNTSVTPYLGGGIGISRNEMGTVTDSFSTGSLNGKKVTEFAYKFAAGTLVNLSEKLSIDINYQYADLGKFKSGVYSTNFGGGSIIYPEAFNGGEIKTQELMIGLQYKF